MGDGIYDDVLTVYGALDCSFIDEVVFFYENDHCRQQNQAGPVHGVLKKMGDNRKKDRG